MVTPPLAFGGDQTSAPFSLDTAELLHLPIATPDSLAELGQQVARLHFVQPAQALALAEAIHQRVAHLSSQAVMLSRWILGEALFYNGQYVTAQHHLAAVYQHYQIGGETAQAARVAVAYAGVLVHLGQVEEALRLATQIEPILTQSARAHRRDLRYLALLPLSVGLAHELTGAGEAALAIYDQHLTRAMGLGDPGLLARWNLSRARALTQLGAYAEALAAFSQAELLLHTLDARSALIRLHLDRSSLLLALQRYPEARAAQALIEQTLGEVMGLEPERQRLALLHVQLALATQSSVPWPLLDALKAAQRALAQAGSLLDEGVAWLLLGRCALRNYQLAEARRCYESVLALAHKSGEPLLEVRALHGVATVEQHSGHSAEAILLLQLALDKLEIVRQKLQIEPFRMAFLHDYLALYEDLIDLYSQRNQWEETFAAVERAKSRLVSEQLRVRQTTTLASATTATDAHTRQLAQHLQATLAQLEQAYRAVRLQQVSDLHQPASLDPALSTITALEQMAHGLMLQIQYQQPFYSALTSYQSTSLAHLQETLGAANFIQYYTLHGRYYAFVINRCGFVARRALATTQQVAHLHRLWVAASARALSLVNQPEPERLVQRLPALLRDSHKQLYGLWEALVQPVAEYLAPDAPLIISPDNELHLLPFHAFYDGSTYLVERHAVTYAPSATVFDHCRQHPGRGTGVLLYGFDDGNLSAVNHELQCLQAIFPHAVSRLGQAASAATFVQSAPQAALIHLAAHAAFHPERPLLSALTLADRRLTLAEITRLDLCATLVVLSGCETAYGKNHGNDLVSLASGFLGAGAQALLVSLWRVADDLTAQLMASFYQQAQRGQPLGEALALAQRSLLQKSQNASGLSALYQHPAFWSPFILLGNGLGSLSSPTPQSSPVPT